MIGSGICPRCIILNLNLSDDDLLRKPEDEIQKILTERWPSLVEKKNLEKTESDEKNFCTFCLGMLQDTFLQSCLDDITKAVQGENYKCSEFRMMVSQPVQLLLFGKQVQNQHRETIDAYRRYGNGLEVKDVMKIYLEPLLEKTLSLKAITKGTAELEINVVVKHEKSEKDLLPKIESRLPECFVKAKKLNEHLAKKRARNDLTIFNLTTVTQALKKLSAEELSKLLAENYHHHPVTLSKITTLRMPVFVAGRYFKYSRDLSQTPWILDGTRKSEMSVEEYIALPIKKELRADGYNFASSGREDIDVQMLGNGRPFLLELQNARGFSSDISIPKLQVRINEGTNLVKVKDLQSIEKEETKNLKDGEEAKTKSYSAVCYVKFTKTNPEDSMPNLIKKFAELSEKTDIKIAQKTPLRVLHRRNLATRTRLVYSLKPEIISEKEAADIVNFTSSIPPEYIFFKLDMTTQAGTYVKEFVHGDFGRTVPNLRSLLGLNVDIISLDVTAVNLDWPPPL